MHYTTKTVTKLESTGAVIPRKANSDMEWIVLTFLWHHTTEENLHYTTKTVTKLESTGAVIPRKANSDMEWIVLTFL